MQGLLCNVSRVPAIANARAPCVASRGGIGRRGRRERVVARGRGQEPWRRELVMAASDSDVAAEAATAATPADAVNRGLALFSEGRVQRGICFCLPSMNSNVLCLLLKFCFPVVHKVRYEQQCVVFGSEILLSGGLQS